MALFKFGKKKEQDESACSCGCSDSKQAIISCCDNIGDISSIKVLGPGCKSCHELFESTKKAVKKIGLNVEVEYVTDMEKIMEYGVASMPVLVINEKVVSAGKALKVTEIEKLLRK